jgi:hypothetical protein
MIQEPVIWKVKDIKEWESQSCSQFDGWKFARPISLERFSIIKRFILSFKVFIGKYDVLDWE